MALDVWFPLAIYYEDVADSASHNAAILTKIHEKIAAVAKVRTSATASWTGDVHDVDRLHLDPDFDWLTGQVEIHAVNYLKLLGHDLAKTDIYIQRSWPVVARRDQRVARHAHHTAHLSVVYYVAAADSADAGQIRFVNDHRLNELSPGIGSEMTQGYSEINPLNFGSALYRPIPGRILVFPAKQTHSVEPNLTDDERVSVSYDLVLTSRDEPGEGHHEFLMPSPSIWRRIGRAGSPAVAGRRAAATLSKDRTALARYGKPIDHFTIPSTEGHLLWTPIGLDDCSSLAGWRNLAKYLGAVSEEAWQSDPSGAVRLLKSDADLPVYNDAIGRVYRHLRDRAVPLDGANVTVPVLQRRQSDEHGAFQRGKAHLSIYVRLDFDEGDCKLEFAEGDEVALSPGCLLIASGLRCHRITGRSYVLHFEIDLPAIGRVDALSLEALRSPEVADHVVFAATTAQPITMPLPPPRLLAEKLDWIERRDRRRYRHEQCPAVQRFLIEHIDPGTASEAELARIHSHGLDGDTMGQLVTIDAVIDAAQCEALCTYAEAHMTSIVPDSVDDLPEYQVNLTIDDLNGLLGFERAEALVRMPQSIGAPYDQEPERIDIFLRKYSLETRPYISFHSDTCTYTLNIALTEADRFQGGRLLALHNGVLQDLTRSPGTAVLHAGNLVHGVSKLEAGTRYSLILFFNYAEHAGSMVVN